MQLSESPRRPYAPPRLSVYGAFQEVTLTAAMNMNMNDNPGMGNLKT
jgi:hypothetical protein